MDREARICECSTPEEEATSDDGEKPKPADGRLTPRCTNHGAQLPWPNRPPNRLNVSLLSKKQRPPLKVGAPLEQPLDELTSESPEEPVQAASATRELIDGIFDTR